MTAAAIEAETPADDAESRLGAAYQIVGAMADAFGVWEHPLIQHALSYLNMEDVSDPLPFDATALLTTLAALERTNVSLTEELSKATLERDRLMELSEELRAALTEASQPPGLHADEVAWAIAESADCALREIDAKFPATLTARPTP